MTVIRGRGTGSSASGRGLAVLRPVVPHGHREVGSHVFGNGGDSYVSWNGGSPQAGRSSAPQKIRKAAEELLRATVAPLPGDGAGEPAIRSAAMEQQRLASKSDSGPADWNMLRTGGDRVYLSSPAVLEPGERTGRHRRRTGTLFPGADGGSRISAEEQAMAVLDEPRAPATDRHFTVVHAAG